MRRAARIDVNQPDIVDELRKAGATVQPLHGVGKGCPDLLVGWRGLNVLMEVKDGQKPPSARELTPDQVKWSTEWRGIVHVVTSPAEAIGLLTILRR